METQDFYRLQIEIFYEEAEKHWNNPDLRDYYLTLSQEASKKYERSLLWAM